MFRTYVNFLTIAYLTTKFFDVRIIEGERNPGTEKHKETKYYVHRVTIPNLLQDGFL